MALDSHVLALLSPSLARALHPSSRRPPLTQLRPFSPPLPHFDSHAHQPPQLHKHKNEPPVSIVEVPVKQQQGQAGQTEKEGTSTKEEEAGKATTVPSTTTVVQTCKGVSAGPDEVKAPSESSINWRANMDPDAPVGGVPAKDASAMPPGGSGAAGESAQCVHHEAPQKIEKPEDTNMDQQGQLYD